MNAKEAMLKYARAEIGVFNSLGPRRWDHFMEVLGDQRTMTSFLNRIDEQQEAALLIWCKRLSELVEAMALVKAKRDLYEAVAAKPNAAGSDEADDSDPPTITSTST